VTFGQYSTPGTGVLWGPDSLVARSNGVVTLNGSVYQVSALVTITAGDAVVIPAGSQFVFTTAASGFLVNGVLRAVGTAESRISFTAATADSLGGSFAGFQFNGTSIDSLCRIAYANITYAYYGLRCIDASPVFHNNYVFKCRRGVQLSGSSPAILHNIIARSYEYGITMTLGSSPTIEYNDIYDNNTQNTSAKNQISIGTQGDNSPIVRFNKIHGTVNTKTGGISVSSLLGNTSGGQIIGNEIYGNSYGIALAGGTITTIVMNNIIRDNNINPDFNTSGSGINVNGNAANTPYIAKNIIMNHHWGITVQNGTTIQAGPQPFLGNIASGNPLEQGLNVFRNNGHGGVKYDLYNNCTNDILAQNNDWGVYDSLGIEERVTHKKDNAQLGLVTFMPFSNSLQLQLRSPNGGENYRPGTQKNILWFSFATNMVKLELSTDNGLTWGVIVDSTSADSGSYLWTVPNMISEQCRVRITDTQNPLITDMSDLVFSIAQVTCLDVLYSYGWNLVSVPLVTSSFQIDSLFMLTTSPAYTYYMGYQPVLNAVPGKGYWLRFSAGHTRTFCGTPVGTNTVPLYAGWNLIGPYHIATPVASITSTPAGILSSPFYGYNNGYILPAALEPGKGYWVRASQAGVLNLATAAGKTVASGNTKVDISAGKIIITDAAGNSQVLYILNQSAGETYMLPPAPPEGVFDVSFSGRNLAAEVKAANKITINGAVYPVTITAEGIALRVTDAATQGKLLNRSLSARNSVRIDNPAITLLQVQSEFVPVVFALQQNYPNPFNPETKIVYSIPRTGKVVLDVYDILGSRITTLVNTVQDAGAHSVQFNAAMLPSGMYFYRLQAEGNTAIRKMMLIK
ncbi:MAG: T9SS type A sorting domain-containing protein, partial [Ignavibacteriales bacterium]|nr:T9SS type A sorting domain-containing protein [Ignavibacteriales bacterium]